MTERLYYADSFIYEFDAIITGILEMGGRSAVILDRTAFYPASGGQIFDTGTLAAETGPAAPVVEVAEDEAGEILHFIDLPSARFAPGLPVHGSIDVRRRRDHMQQHSGQHVLSAAFLRLFQMPTVSFHMGAESCTIDLETKALSDTRLQQAEALANEVTSEDRPVEIRYASAAEAHALGVRKLPPEPKEIYRLIDIRDFDLTACGGTHVRSTGQIGSILLRKLEKAKMGVRVEFVCGARAVRAAREDYATLSEAAALYSTHMRELPAQVRKSLDEIKAGEKHAKKLLCELAGMAAANLLAQAVPAADLRLVVKHFADRDLALIKLVAQNLAAGSQAEAPIVALLSAAGDSQPALVFSQSAGGPHDMNALMKFAVEGAGGRGGGSRDMAQGSVPAGADVECAVRMAASRIR